MDKRGGRARFKALVLCVSLLLAGVLIGHLWTGSGSNDGQPASPREGKQGFTALLRSAISSTPCLRVQSEGIRDAAAADLRSAIAARAPDWDVSSSIEPGECEPDYYLQVIEQKISMTRSDWNTRYETEGHGGAMVISPVGRPDALAVASGVMGTRDALIEKFADNAVEYAKGGGTGSGGKSNLGIIRDGKTCVNLTSENEYADDDEARRLIEAVRRWYIVGGPVRINCEPEVYMSRSHAPIRAGDRTEGHLVAFAMLATSPVPDLAMAWAPTSGRAGVMAIETLLRNVPAQIDPSAQ